MKAKKARSESPTIKELKFIVTRIKKSPLSIMGIAVIAFFAVVALLAPILAPVPEGQEDPYRLPRSGWSSEPQPPSPEHLFGTAQWQYDIFYGCMWGTRTAFRIGIIVVAGNLIIGLIVGTLAGYYRGVIDELLMRLTDIIWAFPGLLLAMALVAVMGPSLDSIVLALMLVGWPSYARVIRSEILRVAQEDYVEAAKAIGCSDLRVITKHILINSIYPIIIMASLDTGAIVLSAAALSFLGLGPPTGYADWGQMISLSRGFIYKNPQEPLGYWFTWTYPGIFIFTFVLGWNLLGDAFRDILDPTLRRR